MIPATILIPARDAALTIQRAVRSALSQECARIVLVDDWSSDATVELARAVAPVDVVRPVEHRTVGFARETGIRAVGSDFVVWLDADDELVPGRSARLVEALTRSATAFAADTAELVDGVSGEVRGTAAIPPFLAGDPTLSRLFERNYVPAPGAIACRTEIVRRLGYDQALHGAEDVDLLLRGCVAGARWSFLDHVGYRQWMYPASLSRDLPNQRAMWRRALLKHSYSTAERCLVSGGWGARIVQWALVSTAIFRADYQVALDRLAVLEAGCAGAKAILEPDGPCPLPEDWRLAFHRGTLHALLGQVTDALEQLQNAWRLEKTAEGANNLGVVLAMGGRGDEAPALFDWALGAFPEYADARANLDDRQALRLTTHPLRHHRLRQDYGSSDKRGVAE